jgi:hypothetical protein
MECRYLKQILALIKLYSVYDSNAAIAARLGLSERTLSGYWEEDKGGGTIPDKNVAAFCDLIAEIVPSAAAPSAARALLTGHPIAFHGAVLPIGGRAWRALVDGPHVQPLVAKVKPLATMGFGEIEDDPDDEPAATIRLFEPFWFEGRAPWRGELVAFAEHGGEWHALALAQGERTITIDGGRFAVPPRKDGRQSHFRERTKPGFYRYVTIAQRGALAAPLRELLHQTNPFSQLTLDMIGDQFGALPPRARLVAAAGILVED